MNVYSPGLHWLAVLGMLLIVATLTACGSDAPAATAAPASNGAMSTPRATPKPPLAQTSTETDREALVAFYNATDGPNWVNNENWLSDAPIGEWNGVTTDGSGRVIELSFFGNQLSGEIPPELGNLSNLEDLTLSVNKLSGEIPPDLGNLSNLRLLRLTENQLSGEIPPELGGLSNLIALFLAGNQLSGCVPEGLRDVNFNDLSELGLPFCSN